MALDKRIFLLGLLITVLIFVSLVFTTSVLNEQREDRVLERMNTLVKQYEDIQAILLLGEFYGDEATCVALESAVLNMNTELWDLGVRIEDYREASDDFLEDPFYLEQKKEFNRREVLYFSLLKKMKSDCQVNQTIVSYFYSKKETCPDCDAQAFVITDVRRDLKDDNKIDDIAIFSFDTDLDLASLKLLSRVYNASKQPCIVVEDEARCGLQNKKEINTFLCESGDVLFCS